jgi:hypothetical protein
MAVVFISPKQRQKMFFMGITILFLLFMGFISLSVFVAKPKEVSTGLVFNKPKVNIDMSIFETEQFRTLGEFTHMQNQYSYTVSTQDGKKKTGYIQAETLEEAEKKLIDQGYIVDEIQLAKIGRTNPFTPYYKTTTQQNK